MTARALPARCVADPRALPAPYPGDCDPDCSSNLAGHLAAGGRVLPVRARLPRLVEVRDGAGVWARTSVESAGLVTQAPMPVQ